MLTTSVNDLYTLNPNYVGKMGSGFIDAYKALQGKEGTVPSAVADFTVTPSHDNALIEWIIPESEEKSIDHHVIYYSKEPFTAEDNLNKLNSVSVDTKFKLSGDAMSYELQNLEASTKYYFAIVALVVAAVSSYLSIPLPALVILNEVLAVGFFAASTVIEREVLSSLTLGPSLVVASLIGDTAEALPQRL